MQIYPNIEPLAKCFKAVLLDAYGVFWGGNGIGVLPGAKQAMGKLMSDGKIVGILSNSSQTAANEIEKLKKNGLNQGEHFHFLISGGEIIRHLFQKEKLPFPTPKKKYFLWGGPHPKFSSHLKLFEGSPYLEASTEREADFIYLSIPHIHGEDQTDPMVFISSIEKLIDSKLPMVCANPDLFAHEGNPPRMVVRQGSIALIYEDLGGEVHYFGKPSPSAYACAMESFHSYGIASPEDVLMVGDTPETDIQGATGFGIKSALLTKTGMMADRIENFGITVIKNLPPSDVPTYLAERL